MLTALLNINLRQGIDKLGDSPAAKDWNYLKGEWHKIDGFQALYTGQSVEEIRVLTCLIVCDENSTSLPALISLQATPAQYPHLLDATAIPSLPTIVNFAPDPSTYLGTPAFPFTEVIVFDLHPSAPTETMNTLYQRLSQKITKPMAEKGSFALGDAGWGIVPDNGPQNFSDIDKAPFGGRWIVLNGWQSLEAHKVFAQQKDLLALRAEMASILAGKAMWHVAFIREE